MRVYFWGTRGSIPAFGPDTGGLGGNTSCVSITQDNTLLILDAGSGIRRLGVETGLERYEHIHILLTHLHMDHIQGLGFFKPLFYPEAVVHIWGPSSTNTSLSDRLKRYLSPPLFPIRLKEFPCKLFIYEVPFDTFSIGPFDITASYILHPGPTIGYRITNRRSSLTYIPDHEPAIGQNPFPISSEWTSGYTLAQHTDLLIHDAQFTPEEYPGRIGWGHCTIEHALLFAELAQVKRLFLFHHDPGRTDQDMDMFYHKYVAPKNYSFEVNFAREDDVVVLPDM